METEELSTTEPETTQEEVVPVVETPVAPTVQAEMTPPQTVGVPGKKLYFYPEKQASFEATTKEEADAMFNQLEKGE